MKLKSLVLCALVSLPFAACERKQPAPAAANAAAATAAATSADDPAVPKLATGTAAKCPVTGEAFTVKDSTVQVTYKGKRYAFCCADCQPTFAKDPAKYAKD
jgi:YHS domain-containing protein